MKTSTGKRDSSEVLLYADSESNADMRYFGTVMVPDAFLAFSHKGKRIAVVSQLEYSRVCKESCFDEVLSMEAVLKDVEGGYAAYPVNGIQWVAKKFGIRKFRVSADFPCGVALKMQAAGIAFSVAEEMLFPERAFKSDAEAKAIMEGNAASKAGFVVVEKLLREAEIRKGYLYHGKRRLTSERVQEAIAIACLGRGAVAMNTIVAGGDQACDPHCRGSGPLKANELIIVDIFPRVAESGFHGDMTRTYLKGKASEEQKALYHTVFEAQQWALGEHRSGKSGRQIYRAVKDGFTEKGYRTFYDKGTPVGFIHGLGHGLGLEVHEPPRVNVQGERLRKGQVITVEPGLYYPGLGGVRVEDVLRVTTGAPELLSNHGYRWQIR